MTAVTSGSPIERLLTAADVAELPRELPSGPISYELLDGRLFLVTPVGAVHGDKEGNFVYYLKHLGQRLGHGRAFGGEVGVLLRRNPDTLVGVDAAFVVSARLPLQLSPEGWLLTIPDLVVEVLCKRDCPGAVARKVADYLAAGVRLVWVADPDGRTVFAHRVGQVDTLREADTLRCPDIIPGFAVSVAEVLGD